LKEYHITYINSIFNWSVQVGIHHKHTLWTEFYWVPRLQTYCS